MSDASGKFVWCEYMADKGGPAIDFYRDVIGWTITDSGMSDRSYMILNVGSTPVGGLMELPKAAREMGAKPGWIGYIGVADVDGTVTKIRAAGGGVHKGPEDIPGVGRFAIVSDPQGAAFVVFAPNASGQAPAPLDPATPGRVGWNELSAADPEKAFGFYSGMFGWTKSTPVDMGPMGTYQLFAIDGVDAGGMMRKMETTPRPFWLYYFNVAEIEAAAGRVKKAGGQILHGLAEVPGGAFICQCLDSQGALFAIVGPKG